MKPFKVFLRRWHSLLLLSIAGVLSSPFAAIAWDFSNQVYCNRLYDRSGRLLLQFLGGVPDFTLDGRHVLSASPADDRTVLYDLHGSSIVEFEGGTFQGFTANEQLVISRADLDRPATYLYDFSGRQLVSFGQPGRFFGRDYFVSLSPNRLQVATYSSIEDTSYLYDLSGNQIAQFEGGFLGFSPNGQQLVTYAYTADKSYLYNIWGRKLAEFRGRFLQFSSNGQHLMTSTATGDRGDTQNHIYDLFGNELDSVQSEEDWADDSLPAPSTNDLPAFQGEFRSLSPDGQLFLTYSQQAVEERIAEERIRQEELRIEDYEASICPRIAR